MGVLKFAAASKKKSPLARARDVYERNPLNQHSVLALSDLFETKGQSKKAEQLWHRFLATEPDSASARINLASLLYRQKRFQAAYEQFSQVGDVGPFAAQAHNGAGACCFAMNAHDLAISHYSKAIKLNNQAPPYYVNLAFALVALEKLADAVEATKLAYTVSSKDASILTSAADHLLQNDAYEEAISLYLEYLELVPTNAQAWSNLATCYRILGQFGEAETAFKQAAAKDPSNPVYLYNLSTVAKAPAVMTCAEGARYAQDSAFQQASYHFALGNAMDGQQDYEQAFHHFEKANAALFGEAPGTGKIASLNLDLAQTEDIVPQAPSPIFIVGMPRSGTTLTERILASHSGVAAAGERNWLKTALLRAHVDRKGSPEARAFRIAENYCAQIPKSLKRTGYLTDKMPLNFRFVKEAALAFPNAKFVHVHRDRRAVAWSNYRTFFTRGGADMGFATHRDMIAKFLQNYGRLVASWQALPKGRVIHLDYEALVRAPEAVTQNLIADLDLPYEAKPSPNTTTNKGIRTASAVQARKKVYQGSSQDWKNYEQFAPDWFDELFRLPLVEVV